MSNGAIRRYPSQAGRVVERQRRVRCSNCSPKTDRRRSSAHLQRLGWIEPNETLEALEPAGAGNMNRTLRARLPQRTLVLKQSVPFVAKYPRYRRRPSASPSKRRSIARPRSRRRSSMRLPEVLGFDPDNRLLALEDLGACGGLHRHLRLRSLATARTAAHDITAGHTTSLLYWLGMLHGLRVDRARLPELENRAMRALNHAHIFDIPLRADNGIDLDRFTRGLGDVARAVGARRRACATSVAALGEIYLGRRRTRVGARAAARRLLPGFVAQTSADGRRDHRSGVCVHRSTRIRRRRVDRALHVCADSRRRS